MRLAGPGTGRFNHVRVDRSLCQPLGVVTQPGRLLLENFDKQVANDFAFLLRLSLALQRRQETGLRIDTDDAYAHMLRKGRHHLVTFPVT